MRPARWQCFVLCALLSVERLAAQDSARGDQVIADPELGASEPAADSGDHVIADPELAGSGDASAADSGDHVIADPELATTPSREALPAPASSAQPEAADVRMVLHTRGWRDWRTSDAREEVWDETTVVAIEATMRRSDSLRFSLGVVAQYHYARLEHAVPDAGAARYEFDAMPTSAYVDATIAAGLHVRVGYQPVHLGRFDAFSATNVLSVYDARQGPATLPEVPEVGQFAALVDYDPLSWLSIRAIYIPFFTPNIVSVSEGDYPLLGIKQTAINQVFDPRSGIVSDNQLRDLLANNLSRADRERIATSALDALAPEPTFSHGQGAIRATAHGPAGELALTASTALEHTPAFRVSNAVLNGVSDPNDLHPISVEYNRFGVISLDGALDVAPFSIGFELAYMLHRTLYSVGVANYNPYDPHAVPLPAFSDIGQVGLRIEYVQNTRWLFALEGFTAYALSRPADPQRWWMFMDQGRYTFGGGGLIGYHADFGLAIELGGAVFNGPGAVISPRIAYALLNGFDLEVGALAILGRTPPAMFSTPEVSLGGLFNYVGHVFVGLRYQL